MSPLRPMRASTAAPIHSSRRARGFRCQHEYEDPDIGDRSVGQLSGWRNAVHLHCLLASRPLCAVGTARVKKLISRAASSASRYPVRFGKIFHFRFIRNCV